MANWDWHLAISGLATKLFSHYDWFKCNEHVAVWLEGVALVLIFGLDYLNRLDETEQLTLLREQVEATTKQSNVTSESLELLKTQEQERQLRELWRVLPILDGMQTQMSDWISLIDRDAMNS